MLCVVSVMAPLTQRPQVVGAVVFGRMVEGRNRQNDATAVPDSVVLYSAKLTFVVCTLQNISANLLPVCWVSGFILW